jgi:hypothetical protein
MDSTMSDFPAKLHEDDTQRQQQLIAIVRDNAPGTLDGVAVDGFTAKLILIAAHKLSSAQRRQFLHLPIHKMVAIAYKLATS